MADLVTMAMNDENEVIELEEKWEVLEEGIIRLTNMLEEVSMEQYIVAVVLEELRNLEEVVYSMCMIQQLGALDHSQQLYDMYVEAFVEYITSTVLPALQAMHGEDMLMEFVRRWKNHMRLVRWLSSIFQCLQQSFLVSQGMTTRLYVVGKMIFLNLVYVEIKVDVKDAVIALIAREREGGEIDQGLVKKVVDIFVGIGMEAYENDFERFMLEDTVAYYKKKASLWTSRSIYVTKTQECLEREKNRANHYLHVRSEQKLLEMTQKELVSHYKKLHVRCVIG